MVSRCLLFFLGCVLILSVEGRATVKLPAVIGNDMVLQRNSEVPLWGTSSRHATVKVTTSWNHSTYRAECDADGNWKVLVRTPEAGGPYQVTLDDGDKVVLTGVLIGEVWVCSGQSNMEISMKGYGNTPILHANDILAHATDPKLRLFHLQRAVSNTPLQDCKGSWETSGPGSAASFSAVGFQFARELQEILGVPVGIIETSWGGTPIEAWMSSQALAPFTAAISRLTRATGGKPSAHGPSCLYNAMINPIVGYGIRGFLWYQGEFNRRYPDRYAALMEAMVTSWRKVWQRDTLPFYYVQIAPYDYGVTRDSVPFLREEQGRAMQLIPHSGMVVTMDVGDKFTIHPPDKTTVAKRLLYWALGDTYGFKEVAYESPSFQSLKITGENAVVTLSPAPRGLTSYDQPVKGFEVAGADKFFYPATARLSRNGVVIVHADRVSKPVAVRYGFKDWTICNLYSTDGLPVAPFRTDDW